MLSSAAQRGWFPMAGGTHPRAAARLQLSILPQQCSSRCIFGAVSCDSFAVSSEPFFWLRVSLIWGSRSHLGPGMVSKLEDWCEMPPQPPVSVTKQRECFLALTHKQLGVSFFKTRKTELQLSSFSN